MKQYKVRVDGKEYLVDIEETNSCYALSSLSMNLLSGHFILWLISNKHRNVIYVSK